VKDQTMLLRQGSPGFLREGRPPSQVFRPTPSHGFKLSVDDGDLTTAVDSWTHFTADLGLQSVGVLGVRVPECSDEGLPCCPDPKPDNPAHALIDFTGLKDKDIRRKGKVLLNHALERDWLYQP